MANIPERAQWEPGVYQLEETDPVLGGPNGVDNLPHKHLANRTTYLKQQQDAIGGEIEAARGAYGSLATRLTALETETLQGDDSLASTTGRTVVHNLGHVNYIVNVVPLEDPQGDLGDVHITKAANAFTIFNSGGFTGAFRYQIMS